MTKHIPPQPLTPLQRHILHMLYAKRLFFPHEKNVTMVDFAEDLGIPGWKLENEMRQIRDRGYVTGGWGELDFVPVGWGKIFGNNV